MRGALFREDGGLGGPGCEGLTESLTESLPVRHGLIGCLDTREEGVG